MGNTERDTKRIGIIGELPRCLKCKQPMEWSRAKLCHQCMRDIIKGRFDDAATTY